jgi:hypothetical protein
MKKYFVALLLVAFTFSIAANLKLGKQITLKDKSSVSKILKDPSKFEGKTVLIEGKILDVCQDSGCWIEVAGEKEGEKIKVKVKDGEIVFPKDSKGKTVKVQGIVEEVTAANSCGDHEKEGHKETAVKETKSDCGGCSGEETKAKTETGGCGGGEETAKVFQVKGLGAVIK